MDKQKCTNNFTFNAKSFSFYNINLLKQYGFEIDNLPFSIRILLENILRKYDGCIVNDEHLKAVANWGSGNKSGAEIPFFPSRVLMQDFTGVPAIVDLAAMRDAGRGIGLDVNKINPLIPVDLIIDHSIQVDYYGTKDALEKNMDKEYKLNCERYKLLKWGQKTFQKFNVYPPGKGICHQVNLEHIGKVAMIEQIGGENIIFPDTLVGADSHTPMINGLGIVGWGVGGIEAEAVMLGQPYYMPIPDVVGIRLNGCLAEGVTATDLVLNIAYILRKYGVVGKFVEYFGPGIKNLPVVDRATISNMTPEYGATVDYFPVDEQTINYMKQTNRVERANLVEQYYRLSGLFYEPSVTPSYTDVIDVDLWGIRPVMAGPSRPHDRIFLDGMKDSFAHLLSERGESSAGIKKKTTVDLDGKDVEIIDGSVVIAAITSCTNTSNPSVMIGAGLIAKKAVEIGLEIKPYVKTSLAPGSRVVYDYLKASGLLKYLETLKFNIVGYGCTTCIGNSGPLNKNIEEAILKKKLTVASVLSGNRNFEARIHPSVRANYLASPMLVVIYALAGRVDIDILSEPIGTTAYNKNVYLNDLWPKNSDIEDLITKTISAKMYESEYNSILEGDSNWNDLKVDNSITYNWEESSTYIKKPPYFDSFSKEYKSPQNIKNAAVLLLLGDTVTTDHISPAGTIKKEYPTGQYLSEHGVEPDNYNSYGSRRGNHEAMIRGTFGNIRLKNNLVAPEEGSYTVKFPENKKVYIYDAAMAYADEHRPVIIIAGKEYGTGSSRDWAAKGTSLLGVKAVIAESYERIHRSNLVGMGVLPLQFKNGENWKILGLNGFESYSIQGIEDIAPKSRLHVKAVSNDGVEKNFEVISRLDLDIEVEYFCHGGILKFVLRHILDQR